VAASCSSGRILDVQILYSHDVHLDGVTIRNNEGGKGPSTDGIDIDSSRKILVEHADIDVNDDALCLKAGRDSDGLRVNRPTEDVVLRDSIIRRGAAAVTIGSETSGGFRNIEAYNITALSGVPSGVLFKSAHTRGGMTSDIRIHDLTLVGRRHPDPHHHELESELQLRNAAAGIEGYSPVLGGAHHQGGRAEGTAPLQRCTHWNIKATGAKSAFNVSAYPNATLDDFRIDHLDIEAATAGTIANAKNWKLSENQIKTADGSKVVFTDAAGNNSSDIPLWRAKIKRTPAVCDLSPTAGVQIFSYYIFR